MHGFLCYNLSYDLSFSGKNFLVKSMYLYRVLCPFVIEENSIKTNKVSDKKKSDLERTL